MRSTSVVVLLCLALLGTIFAHARLNLTPVAEDYEIYVTVGKGEDGENGPVAGAKVTIEGPAGEAPQTKSTDEEGIVKFTVKTLGRYMVRVKANDFADYEGRVFVERGKTPAYYLAGLQPPTAPSNKARIVVTVKDADSGWPLSGASVHVTRKDNQLSDNFSTDRSTTDNNGQSYVMVDHNASTTGGLTFEVLVSHPDYVDQAAQVKVEKNVSRDYPVLFLLKVAKGQRTIAITTVEEGTRAPVMSARVTLDAGGNKFFAQSTGPDGKAVFRVPPLAKYAVKITTQLFEEQTDEIDLIADSGSGTVEREYELARKDPGKSIRRALILTVRLKDEKGERPGKGVNVSGPGLHPQVTDDSGRAVFLHTIPPGETITVTANTTFFKPGSATVLVRDKGVMVDIDKFTKDTRRGMTDLQALANQGVTGFDTASIVLAADPVGNEKTLTGSIECADEATPGEPVGYSVKLNYSEGDADAVTVEEVIQVFGPDGQIVSRAGNIRAVNKGEPSSADYSFTPEKPGTYRIVCTVRGERSLEWKGERTVRVAEDRRAIALTGDVVAKKGLVKLDERVQVMVNVLYQNGPDQRVTLDETIELFDPKGEVVQNNFAKRTLTRGSYSERTMNIVCQAPGVYRLRSTIKGPDGSVLWTGEGQFEVDKVGTAVTQKPGQGYYRLKEKILGQAPPPASDQYGRATMSMSESSWTFSYQTTSVYENYAELNIKFAVPPTIIKAGETIELTIQGTGKVWGKDRGYVGTWGDWVAEGGTAVKVDNCFVGIASDGKEYPSDTGLFRITVGSGGPLRIANSHGGPFWGSTPNWRPCTYVYEWVPNAAPPEAGSGKPPTMEGGTTTDRESAEKAMPGRYRDTAIKTNVNRNFTVEFTISGSGESMTITGFVKQTAGNTARVPFSGKVDVTSKSFRVSGRLDLGKGKFSTVTVSGRYEGGVVIGSFSMAEPGQKPVQGTFRAKKIG